MANYSTTKLTPSSTTKFPANNGNTPGYVEGADLTTKAEFNDAINAITIVQGSNSNGKYIRIPNLHLQICWHEFTLGAYDGDSSFGTASVPYAYGYWSYPMPFSSSPKVFATAIDTWPGIYSCSVDSPSKNNVTVWFFGGTQGSWSGSPSVYIMAIGTYSD